MEHYDFCRYTPDVFAARDIGIRFGELVVLKSDDVHTGFVKLFLGVAELLWRVGKNIFIIFLLNYIFGTYRNLSLIIKDVIRLLLDFPCKTYYNFNCIKDIS